MQIWSGNGNIATDLKLVGTSGKVATTAIAVDRGMRDSSNNWITDFLNLRFIGEKSVTRAQKELAKGVHAVINGKVCHESYTDKDGNKRYLDYILVSQFQVPHTRNANTEEEAHAPAAEEQKDFINIPENTDADGLPFN